MSNTKEITIQEQIDGINQKIDLILDYVNQQRLKTQMLEDLANDVSIVGKDIFDTTVSELDKYSVEVNPDEIKLLLIRLLKNADTFHSLLDMLESANDFVKDALPILNEMMIDFMKKLNEIEQKGYFKFINNWIEVINEIVANSSEEDMEKLSKSIPNVLAIMKKLTQPQVIESMKNAVEAYEATLQSEPKKYSIFKMLREMQKPEMKRTMWFLAELNKNISNKSK